MLSPKPVEGSIDAGPRPQKLDMKYDHEGTINSTTPGKIGAVKDDGVVLKLAGNYGWSSILKGDSNHQLRPWNIQKKLADDNDLTNVEIRNEGVDEDPIKDDHLDLI